MIVRDTIETRPLDKTKQSSVRKQELETVNNEDSHGSVDEETMKKLVFRENKCYVVGLAIVVTSRVTDPLRASSELLCL